MADDIGRAASMCLADDDFVCFAAKVGDVRRIKIDRDRDDLLTEFSKATLRDRYLMPEESYQDLFARVACWFSDDNDHAQRLYDYISKLWFMPATPVLSNGGTNRGLPISCFLNRVGDSLDEIIDTWKDNAWLAARGGGIGTYWGDVRSIGERVGDVGKTSGVVPFIKVMDSLTLAISQGSLRRGSAACYLPVWHPEIEEFVEIRKPTGGDPNRKTLNIHNGVVIDNDFMRAVERGAKYALTSPVSGEVMKTVDARSVWSKILTARIETGEPYILNIDAVNDAIPEHHRELGLKVRQSNLCSEITLPTGLDHLGNERTAVCCLSSVNAEMWDQWGPVPEFIEDIMRFLDNVIQDFIDRAEGKSGFEKARYSAIRERSVGLGVMGFHSMLQKTGVMFESPMAKGMNMKLFKFLRERCDAADVKLAHERGACPDAAEVGVMRRFSNKMAIAPTASISVIAGNASPGIEPFIANSFTQKTLSGSFTVRNKYLKKLLAKHGKDNDEVWSSITANEGSVQHLDFLSDAERDVFKTAFEIDQRWIIDFAADRTPFICQAQSLNIFLPADIHKRDLHGLHHLAWRRGVKSLYYCRSKSLQRADVVTHNVGTMPTEHRPDVDRVIDYGEDICLACQ